MCRASVQKQHHNVREQSVLASGASCAPCTQNMHVAAATSGATPATHAQQMAVGRQKNAHTYLLHEHALCMAAAHDQASDDDVIDLHPKRAHAHLSHACTRLGCASRQTTTYYLPSARPPAYLALPALCLHTLVVCNPPCLQAQQGSHQHGGQQLAASSPSRHDN